MNLYHQCLSASTRVYGMPVAMLDRLQRLYLDHILSSCKGFVPCKDECIVLPYLVITSPFSIACPAL